MCNHFANIPEIRKELKTWREFISWSLDAPMPDAVVDDEIWPRRQALVVRQNEAAGGAFADVMQWGVPLSLPGKRPGTHITKYVTNVRNLESPFWRSMLSSPEQRCLVPFSRFAEPKAGAGREEHWFAANNRALSAFAGVWRWAEPPAQTGLAFDEPTTERAKVFAFLTCAPNPLVAPLHPKAMPVILHEADYESWLTAPLEAAVKLAVPYPSQLMRVVEMVN